MKTFATTEKKYTFVFELKEKIATELLHILRIL